MKKIIKINYLFLDYYYNYDRPIKPRNRIVKFRFTQGNMSSTLNFNLILITVSLIMCL